MGKSYGQLGLTERIEIYRLHADGKSLRGIATALGRSVSTISRELQRNGKPSRIWPGGYHPQRAQKLTQRRHARGRAHKLERLPFLRQQVLDRLARGWSPEQIAGRLAQGQPNAPISYESIYRYIYWRSGSFNGTLHRLLPRHKYRRRRRRENLRWSKSAIFHRASIQDRPRLVDRRTQPGHWEADLMGFSKQGPYLLVAHERQSRRTLLLRACRSITFDNGSEFSKHYLLRRTHGIQTWFCDTHSPWQKGGIENAIGRLRRLLPRKTDLDSIPQRTLSQFIDRYNHTPRKCLGFKTPNEVFFQKTVALQT